MNQDNAVAEELVPLHFSSENERLRFFIAGLASLNLNAPRGQRPDVHHAKMLRQIRSAAKTMMEQVDAK